MQSWLVFSLLYHITIGPLSNDLKKMDSLRLFKLRSLCFPLALPVKYGASFLVKELRPGKSDPPFPTKQQNFLFAVGFYGPNYPQAA